ncbi:MAG TPA: hypothetical protein VIU37_05885 [Candidatus Limnocylindrales bacterium]|jgi:hypothetical protein
MFRTLVRLALLGAIVSAAVAAVRGLDRWRSSWGVDPADVDRMLPGDDLVPDPSHTETRGIDIGAPPSAVWPWLVQMGYERAGWYSYDQLDMKGRSADTILPDLQSIKVGDILPTFPGGGFEVRVVDDGRALAVYTDTAITTAQAAAFAERQATVPLGLRASGTFMRSTPPDFAASWAFVLDPLPGGRTRLIERVRVWYGAGTPLSGVATPVFGFGVFLMTRRQMLGIRDRAERAGRASVATVAPAPVEAVPAVDPEEAIAAS